MKHSSGTGHESGAPTIRSLCDAVLEVNLKTKKYRAMVCGPQARYTLPPDGDYAPDCLAWLYKRVDPQTADRLKAVLGLEALLAAAKNGSGQGRVAFRMHDADGAPVQMESRVFTEKDRAFVVLYDKDMQDGRQEEALHETRYENAIRSIYDEISEINYADNSFHTIYAASGKYNRPGEGSPLDASFMALAAQHTHPDDRGRIERFTNRETLDGALASGSISGEFRRRGKDGHYRWVSLTILPLKDKEEVYLWLCADISDKKSVEEMELRNQELHKKRMEDARYKIIVERTETMVFEWQMDGDVQYIADRLKERFAGYYDARNLFDIWVEDGVVHPRDHKKFTDFIGKCILSKQNASLDIQLLNRDGEYIWCRVSLSFITDEDGRLDRIVGMVDDIDKETRERNELKYRAEYDMLTGIYNEAAFCGYAQKVLKAHPDAQYAVIRMDINHFKFINDIYGMEEGDKLLRYIAGIIRGMTAKEGICGRITNDIFALCTPYGGADELIMMTAAITEQLGRYPLGYSVLPAFGICEVKDRAVAVSTMLDWANIALGTVKGNMLGNWAFYDSRLRARQLDERLIEDEMGKALQNEEFTVYFQPKHRIDTGEIAGAEALVRWAHPEKGLLKPDYFVPLFERNGFIVRMDEYVWKRACIYIRQWRDRGWAPPPVSLNVSRLHVYNTGFDRKLLELLRRYEIPRNLIRLELTESMFVEKTAELIKRMRFLRDQGILFELDDFGTGYSSLHTLQDAPVDTVKLDKTFLRNLSDKGGVLLRYTVAMARELGLDVIAEGVEEKEQADFLREAGCNVAQGYYFSRPMPAEQFEKLAFGDK